MNRSNYYIIYVFFYNLHKVIGFPISIASSWVSSPIPRTVNRMDDEYPKNLALTIIGTLLSSYSMASTKRTRSKLLLEETSFTGIILSFFKTSENLYS